MQNKEEEGKQLLGSKAWQLLRRRALGYAVPAFFVLDRNFFFRFLGERRARYEELLRHPDAETGEAISALLADCEFTAEDAAELIAKLSTAVPRAERFAVRSSLILRGEERHSFEGIFQSYMHVPCGEEILAAVKNCYLSCFSARATGYMLRYGLFDEDMAVAVILQEMIATVRNFAVYTTNPDSGDPEELLVVYDDAVGQQRIVLSRTGEIRRSTVSGAPDEADEVLFVRLATLAGELERDNVPTTARRFEFVEGKSGSLWLVQESEMAVYRHLDKREPHFYLEAAARDGRAGALLTPLGFDLLQGLYQKAGCKTVLFEGRLYMRREGNAEEGGENSQAAELLQRLPQHYAISRYLQQAEQEKQPEEKADVTAAERWQAIEAASTALGALGRLAAEAEESAKRCYAAMLIELKARQTEHPEGLLHAALMTQGGMKSAAFVQALSALLRTVQESSDLRGLFAVHTAQELEGICWRLRAEEGKAQRERSVFATELYRFLEQFGAYGAADYVLERESLRQNPQPLFRFLKRYADAKPVQIRTEQREVSEQAQEELMRQLGFFGGLWGKRLLQELVFFLRARENLDFLAQRRVDGLRRKVVRLGEQLVRQGELAEAQDLFYLHREELGRAFAGEIERAAFFRSLQPRMNERKREQERNAALPRYRELCCFGLLARENMTVIRREAKAGAETDPVPVEAGGAIAEGEAGFFNGETLPRRSGTVLFAERFSERLLPLFAVSRGLVLGEGSIWSHEAVLARELGILTLLGLPNLFDHVREGEWVRADGRRGILERFSEGEAENIEEVEV